MASVTSRLYNLWKGFLSIFVRDLEVANPEIVFQNALDERIRKRGELSKATSRIVSLRNKLTSEYEGFKNELHQVMVDLEAAVATNDDELGGLLMTKKADLERRMANIERELEKVRQQAESAKAALLEFDGEIQNLERKRDELLAKKATAEARIEIQETVRASLSTSADKQALSNVENEINRIHAEADMNDEISGNSLDARLKTLRAQSGTTVGKSQFEKFKAQKAAAAAGTVTKTM